MPALRQVLLQYLLPWLYNMELVDPNVCNPLTTFLNKLGENRTLYAQPFLKGDGWGSPQATEMVLNNLMYITCKVRRPLPLLCYIWSDNSLLVKSLMQV